MSNCPKKEREPRDEVESSEDEDLQVYKSPMGWPVVNAMHPRRLSERNLTIESSDISSISVYLATEQLLKSGAFSLVGAVLFTGKSMILWIDFPISLIKKYSKKRDTNRVYWSSEIKSRNYSYLEDGTFNFGLSPALQELSIRNDLMLREYGLVLKEITLPWAKDFWPGTVRALIIDIDLIPKEPCKTKLKTWLGMEDDEGEKDLEEILEKELKKRWTDLN